MMENCFCCWGCWKAAIDNGVQAQSSQCCTSCTDAAISGNPLRADTHGAARDRAQQTRPRPDARGSVRAGQRTAPARVLSVAERALTDMRPRSRDSKVGVASPAAWNCTPQPHSQQSVAGTQRATGAPRAASRVPGAVPGCLRLLLSAPAATSRFSYCFTTPHPPPTLSPLPTWRSTANMASRNMRVLKKQSEKKTGVGKPY